MQPVNDYSFLLWFQYELLHEKSREKLEVLREITGTVTHRKHLDSSIDFIGKLLFGVENGPSTLGAVRAPGQPLVDDWDCLKRMVSSLLKLESSSFLYESYLGCRCLLWSALTRSDESFYRYGSSNPTVGRSLSTVWSTCGPSRTFATVALLPSRWSKRASVLAAATTLRDGARWSRVTALDDLLQVMGSNASRTITAYLA